MLAGVLSMDKKVTLIHDPLVHPSLPLFEGTWLLKPNKEKRSDPTETGSSYQLGPMSNKSCQPYLLHVIPVGDDSMFDGVLESKDSSLALSLVSHIAVFLAHTHHHTL